MLDTFIGQGSAILDAFGQLPWTISEDIEVDDTEGLQSKSCFQQKILVGF